MPTIREKTTKAGKPFFEIVVSRGRNQSQLTKRWYPPEGWSRRAVSRELAKAAAEFERQCKSGEAISRAEQKEKDLLKKQEAAKIQTLRQYGEKVFMPRKIITMSENSRCSYQGNLDKWIYPALGDLKMPDITPAQITALLLSIQAQGRSHATALKIYTVLHSLFRLAYMEDVVEKNPMDRVSRPVPRKDEIRGAQSQSLTLEELRTVLDALDAEPLKWRTLVHLLIDTGIRRGECCGLQWKDVDFQNNTITISGNLCYTPQKGIYLDTPKNGRTRTVDVDPAVMTLLRALRSEQASHAISAYVFTQENSAAPMHPQTPTRYMKKLSVKYRLPDLHPHKLRHTFASLAITAGADVASVSQVLGHADVGTTLRTYTHASEESRRRASQIFREAIKNAGQG